MEFNNSRRLCLSGAPNTRDLGGLKTTDGRTVRSGRLLRSGALGQLTESDIQLLQSIPLRTVVDFRTDREISEKPDLDIPGVRLLHCPILPQLTGVTRELGEDGMPAYFRMALEVGMTADTWMAGLYLPLVESEYSQSHYREFFRILMQHTDGALLYHCTIGKDRVGVATMLLLSALGVDRDTIMEDYLLTTPYTEQNRKAVCREAMAYTDDPAAQFALEAFESARKSYLNAAYQSIEQNYGSVDTYLSKVLEIDTKERKLLRTLYLE